MLTFTAKLFIFVQLAQGFIYKCGENISVKIGEKRNIKFWVEEGELMKIDAVTEQNKIPNEGSLFSKEIREKHPFIEQHIAILNRLNNMQLSHRIGQVSTSQFINQQEILPETIEQKKSDPIETSETEKAISNSFETQPDTILDPQIPYVTSDKFKPQTHSLRADVKVDEELLKIIKEKETKQVDKSDPVLKLTLSKQTKINLNINRETIDSPADPNIKTKSNIQGNHDSDKHSDQSLKLPPKHLSVVELETLTDNISESVTDEFYSDVKIDSTTSIFYYLDTTVESITDTEYNIPDTVLDTDNGVIDVNSTGNQNDFNEFIIKDSHRDAEISSANIQIDFKKTDELLSDSNQSLVGGKQANKKLSTINSTNTIDISNEPITDSMFNIVESISNDTHADAKIDLASNKEELNTPVIETVIGTKSNFYQSTMDDINDTTIISTTENDSDLSIIELITTDTTPTVFSDDIHIDTIDLTTVRVLPTDMNIPYSEKNTPEKIDEINKQAAEDSTGTNSVKISVGILEALHKYLISNITEEMKNITKPENNKVMVPLENINSHITALLLDETNKDNSIVEKQILNNDETATNKQIEVVSSEINGTLPAVTTEPNSHEKEHESNLRVSNISEKINIGISNNNKLNSSKLDDSKYFTEDEIKLKLPISKINETTFAPDNILSSENDLPQSTTFHYDFNTKGSETYNLVNNSSDLENNESPSTQSSYSTTLEMSEIETADEETHFESSTPFQLNLFDILSNEGIDIPKFSEVISNDTTIEIPFLKEQSTMTPDSTEPASTVLTTVSSLQLEDESGYNLNFTTESQPVSIYIGSDSVNEKNEDSYVDEFNGIAIASKDKNDSDKIHSYNSENRISPNIQNNVNDRLIMDNSNPSSENKNTNDNVLKEVFVDFIKTEIDKTMNLRTQLDTIESSAVEKNNLIDKDDISGTPGQIDVTSIRDLHKQYVDVKPELFEIRNVLQPMLTKNEKSQKESSISEIDLGLLTAIKDYPKTIDSPVPQNVYKATGTDEIIIPYDLLHTINKENTEVSNEKAANSLPSRQKPSSFLHISDLSNQSKVEDSQNVTVNELNVLTSIVSTIVKENDTMDEKSLNDVTNEKSNINIKENTPTRNNPEYHMRVELVPSVDRVIFKEDSQKDIIESLNLVSDLLHDSFNVSQLNETIEDEEEQPDDISNTRKTVAHQGISKQYQKGSTKTADEKHIYEPKDKNIQDMSTSSSGIQSGDTKESLENETDLEIIPYEMLNMQNLNSAPKNKENLIEIKENGIKVSIVTPASNLKNDHYDNAVSTNNLINQQTFENKPSKTITIDKLSENSKIEDTEGYQNKQTSSTIKIDKLSENIIIEDTEGNQTEFNLPHSGIKDVQLEKESVFIPKVEIVITNGTEQSNHKDEKQQKHTNVNEESENKETQYSAIKLKDILPTADTHQISSLTNGNITYIDSEFDQFPGNVKNTEEIDTEVKTTTDKFIIQKNSSLNISNKFSPVLSEKSTNEFKENKDIVSKTQDREQSLTGESEIDDILNPTLTELEKEFNFDLSDEDPYTIDDLTGNMEDTKTSENKHSEVNYESDNLAEFLHEFNRPPSSEKQENVIDMIKDFIFSIPQFSNSKHEKDSSVNFSHNDQFNVLHLEDRNDKSGEPATNYRNELKSTKISPSLMVDNEEIHSVQKPTDQLQKRTGPDHSFDSYWKNIQSRRDDFPIYYGGDSPFFIKLPGSPNTVPVILQYEPVKVNYVPAEKIRKSEINSDLVSKLAKSRYDTSNMTAENYSDNALNTIKQSYNPDPFFIMNSPNLSDDYFSERIPQIEEKKEMFVDMNGKLSIGSKTHPKIEINPDKNEILYPGKSQDVEAYSSIDTQSLTNLVFQMGPKLATPSTRESNPQYTPFPLTTNPPLTTQSTNWGNDEDREVQFLAGTRGTASTEYYPIPSINFTDNSTEVTAATNQDSLRTKEKKLLPSGNLNYHSPQRSALHESNYDPFLPSTRYSPEEDFDVVALANFLHQSQKGWIDQKPVALPTIGSWRGSSWDNYKYVAEDDSWQPSLKSSPWLKSGKDSKTTYDAFYSPEDIPGIDPALFSYRKNVPSVRQSRGINVDSLKTYINNLPLPLREELLSPSSKFSRRSRRHVFMGEHITCDWNIQTDPNLYLVVTFRNLSAEFTVDCQGAYIEVERENNGFEARWCGNRVSMDASRSHVIFAKSHIRVNVYDNGDGTRKLPTGFEADVEAIDLFNTEEYAKLALTNARTHMRKLRLAKRA